MGDFPKTLMEFERRFATEEACQAHLVRVRWPEGVRCPRCAEMKTWPTTRGRYECSRCGFQVSALAGTIFQDTKYPLQLWFRAMWHVSNQKHGISALGLQRALGLGSYRTAWTWLHKLRAAMVRVGRARLTGEVEIDETYLGGPRPGKRGRGAAGKSLVLIAAQAEGQYIGRIRLKRIRDTSAESLEGAVRIAVEPGSIVRTDGLPSYSRLSEKGYVHKVAREETAVGDNLLPRVNRVAALLKRWLMGTHQGRFDPVYLDAYLEEFTFRFNRRTSQWRGKLFHRLLEQAVCAHTGRGRPVASSVQVG